MMMLIARTKAVPAPELLAVDAVAPLDLAVLLRTAGLGVPETGAHSAEPDPRPGGSVPELVPGMLDEPDDIVGDPPLLLRRVSGNQPRDFRGSATGHATPRWSSGPGRSVDRRAARRALSAWDLSLPSPILHSGSYS